MVREANREAARDVHLADLAKRLELA